MIIRVYNGVKTHLSERIAEWVLAFAMFNWGRTLLGPTDLFLTNPALSGLAFIAPEHVWGWVMEIIGGLRIAALLLNGTFAGTVYSRWSPHIRGVTATVSAFIWFQVILGLMRSHVETTGMAIYPSVLALETWCVIRAAREAGSADRKALQAKRQQRQTAQNAR